MAQQHLAATVYVRECMAIAEVAWRSCCKRLSNSVCCEAELAIQYNTNLLSSTRAIRQHFCLMFDQWCHVFDPLISSCLAVKPMLPLHAWRHNEP